MYSSISFQLKYLSGLPSVRAFGAEERFFDAHYARLDKAHKLWYFMWLMNRCENTLLLQYALSLIIQLTGLLLRLDIIGSTSVFVATILVFIARTPAGLAALVIVSAVKFKENLYWTCRGISETELSMK